MKKKSIIFLDFDGVLCDSAKEAYVLSRWAYLDIDVHAKIEDEAYFRFLNNRYLVSNSWQYYYLMEAILDKRDFNSFKIKECFQINTSNGIDEKSENFNKKFLSKRQELMTNDFAFWNSLETPMTFLKKLEKIIQKQSSNVDFALLSTKNKEAIINKFNFWNFKFNEKLIFEKNDLKNITKGEFIDKFLSQHQEYQLAILVDDNKENILSCANVENLNAFLTDWGYVEDKTNAKSEEEIIKNIEELL